MIITTTINGNIYTREVDDNKTLLHFLRNDLGLTGTKESCGAGECGACTIFLNGKTVNACMVLAVEIDGSTVETIEGEAKNGKLSVIQNYLDQYHAVQCGYCTAGMVMSIRELLKHNPKPSIKEIQHGIEGNFCRCTGYTQIIEAVLHMTKDNNNNNNNNNKERSANV